MPEEYKKGHFLKTGLTGPPGTEGDSAGCCAMLFGTVAADLGLAPGGVGIGATGPTTG
jgi:hypothetical protein